MRARSSVLAGAAFLAGLATGCEEVGLERYYELDTGALSGPAMEIVPVGDIVFDPRSPESVSATQEVVIRSIGDQDLPIIDVYLDEWTSAAFDIPDDLPLPRKLPPGAEYPVDVTFAPYAVGEFDGTFVVEIDNGGVLDEEQRGLYGKGCPAEADGCL